jgi:acetylornithine deacetylase/succinyl-diaminopimelate desuccinylase-like protein
MQELDYDETWIDAAGNVIGLVRGGDGPTTMFNGHMDIVDAGNPDDWLYPPFEAEVYEGHIWGRGSADMKGGLAAMISAAGLFKVWGCQPKGDVLVCAAGLEEVGGWGSHQLMKVRDLGVDRAVVGEPTANRLLLGHRGRIILQTHIQGESRHGSNVNPEANPLLSLAGFLNALPGTTAALAERVSYLTIAPTALSVVPSVPNVTPSEVTQTLDVRVGPDVDTEMVRREVNALLDKNLGQPCSGQVVIARQKLSTHTGIKMEVDDLVPGYELPADHPWAQEARASLDAVLGQDPLGELALYTCDATRLGEAGVPTVIFGPGDIAVAHTTREKLPIEQLLESVVGYMALAL